MIPFSILSHKQKLWFRKFAKQNYIKLDIRALSGILYLLRTGCQWRMIPPRYGKWKTLYQNLFLTNGRWVVERTFVWMDNFRRLSRNYEQHPHTAQAMAQLASIAILLNKL